MKKKKKNDKKIYFILGFIILAISVAYICILKYAEDDAYRTISVIEVNGTVSVVKEGIEYSAYP